MVRIMPFPILRRLKTPENPKCSGVSKRYKKGTLARKELVWKAGI